MLPQRFSRTMQTVYSFFIPGKESILITMINKFKTFLYEKVRIKSPQQKLKIKKVVGLFRPFSLS